MDYTNYINAELMILIPVLNAIGYWLKNKTKLKDKYIPLILGAVGIVLSIGYSFGGCGGDSPIVCLTTAAVQGVLIAASSVYANQIYKQTKKED